jgi:hypothetical protein
LGSFSHHVRVSSTGTFAGFTSPNGFEEAPALANGDAPVALGAEGAANGDPPPAGLAGEDAPKGDAVVAAFAVAPNGLPPVAFAGTGAPKGEAAVAVAGAGFTGASSAAAGMSNGLVASFRDPIPATDLFVSNGSWNGSVFFPVTLPSPKPLGSGLGERFLVWLTGASTAVSSSSPPSPGANSRASPRAPFGRCSTAFTARPPPEAFLPKRPGGAAAPLNTPPEIVHITDAMEVGGVFVRARPRSAAKSDEDAGSAHV